MDGFESLALSCKRFFAVSRLSDFGPEHNQLKRQFGSVDRYTHPIIIFNEIRRQPILAEASRCR